MMLVIENCEPELSRWLYLEYKHAAEIWGEVVFTNVNSSMEKKLLPLGVVEKKPFHTLYPGRKAIILDPLGEETLQTEDFSEADYVVVGGILGEAAPKGRTAQLISSKAMDARIRNLGETQLTIDTAALVAKMIQMGMKMREIEVTKEVEVRLSPMESVVLPYGYVVIEGKLVLTPGLEGYFLSR